MRAELIPPLLAYHVVGGGAAPVVPWYLAGGVSAANCIAAYQPKGAADYAASKVNIAKPGTYDAADGAAYPAWAAATGWTFTGTSSQYLDTGLVPILDQTWSAIAIVYTADASNTSVLFTRTGSNLDFGIFLSNFTTYIPHNSKNISCTVSSLQNANSVLAVSAKRGYQDGSLLTGTIADGTGTATRSIYIGAGNITGTANFFFTGRIAAVAIYSATLTAPQVAAITTAMNAL